MPTHSLPSSPSLSKEASNSVNADRAARRRSARSASPSTDSGQSLVRATPEVKETDNPPFQKVTSRKAVRKKRRQDLLSVSLSESHSQGTSPPSELALAPPVVFGSFEQLPLGPVQAPLN